MLKEILIPDIGNYANVPIIEILVEENQEVEVEASLLTLETDKATMEIPSPFKGIIRKLHLKVGDNVSSGDLFAAIEVLDTEAEKVLTSPAPEEKKSQENAELTPSKIPSKPTSSVILDNKGEVYAGPAVRRLARVLDINLNAVKGTGPKNRIQRGDLEQHIKQALNQSPQSNGMGLQIAALNPVDFSQFGEIESKPLSRIKKLSGNFLQRNWVMAPHVTQFDEADITEMEAFRKEQQLSLNAQNIKLTPLVFLMKAVVAALKAFPQFNASLDETGSHLIYKKYFNIGIAVDTPNGLVVPVIRDVHQKGLIALAQELNVISQKARNGELTGKDMQGGCFSISSLGGIGGTAFTPIINLPEVAILGVSKAQMKPVYEGGNWLARLMLPLSLSYDHRVIDGAEAARFISFLSKHLTDIRGLLL
ncbi:MAG: aceF [Francisellaceae bacterium]|nr:aceF [Francisellaceae bacterium]